MLVVNSTLRNFIFSYIYFFAKIITLICHFYVTVTSLFQIILVNCKKSCKKCDDERPCQRCIRLNIAETCRDSIRKERKLGKKVLIGEAGMKRSRLIREIYNSSSYVNVSRKNNKKSAIKNHGTLSFSLFDISLLHI